MKKKLIIILAVILLLLILNFKSIFEKLIENRVSRIVEHNVKLNIKKFNLLSGFFEFNNITLENKKNFVNQNIFEAEKIVVKSDPKTYLSNLVMIEKLSFYNPKFFFEIKNIDNKGNKKDNLKIIEKLTGEIKPKIYPKKLKDKNFLIKQLDIDNPVAYINYKNNNETLKIPLSLMTFSNVGNSGNNEIKFQHYKNVMKLIVNDIFFRIPDEGLRNLIKMNYNID